MSNVVQQTLSTLPGLLGQPELGAGLGAGSAGGTAEGGGPSRGLATLWLGGLIQNITVLTSKHANQQTKGKDQKRKLKTPL
ncbi:UNVERIFIED_CONTAM: hypothetical protein K2H54_051936 [Gekko kuhli]